MKCTYISAIITEDAIVNVEIAAQILLYKYTSNRTR